MHNGYSTIVYPLFIHYQLLAAVAFMSVPKLEGCAPHSQPSLADSTLCCTSAACCSQQQCVSAPLSVDDLEDAQKLSSAHANSVGHLTPVLAVLQERSPPRGTAATKWPAMACGRWAICWPAHPEVTRRLRRRRRHLQTAETPVCGTLCRWERRGQSPCSAVSSVLFAMLLAKHDCRPASQ